MLEQLVSVHAVHDRTDIAQFGSYVDDAPA